MVSEDDTRAAEARAALRRLEGERALLEGSISDSPTSPPADDKIERWGKIIGRTLGWGAALFLAWQLLGSFGG